MDGNDIRNKFICLQDIARDSVETLLMHYVGHWSGDSPYQPRGKRLHQFLTHYNNMTQQNFSKDLHRDPMVQKSGLFFSTSNVHFENPIAVNFMDITSLCRILDQDIPQFAVRSAKHRQNGVYSKIVCGQTNHKPFTCSQHSVKPHNAKQKQKTKNCGMSPTQCIEFNTSCCDTCNTCPNCRARLGLPRCPQELIRDGLQKLREFRNMVAHKTPDTYEGLLTNTYQDEKFKNCTNFESLWKECVSRITNILELMVSNNSMTQVDLDGAMAKIRVILYNHVGENEN